MQPLTVLRAELTPFSIPFREPFHFAGNTLSQRTGFYLDLFLSGGSSARGEIAPLPGMSHETDRHARHEAQELLAFFKGLIIPVDSKELFSWLRQEPEFQGLCPSVRFGLESAVISLAAQARGQRIVEFLGGNLKDISTAALLQGPHAKVVEEAGRMSSLGYKTFKLKVGDRNIPLDVKKVQDLRGVIGKEAMLRLDANRVWSFQEAVTFAQLAGHEGIEFIEEPLSDPARLGEFYQQTHMPVALDETLSVVKCAVNAPGRCSPTLAHGEGVKAYILKPTILGGIMIVLDWIQEARSQGKKAVISSAFESSVGLKVLAHLACLTDTPSGLGTERWFQDVQPLVSASGVIGVSSI